MYFDFFDWTTLTSNKIKNNLLKRGLKQRFVSKGENKYNVVNEVFLKVQCVRFRWKASIGRNWIKKNPHDVFTSGQSSKLYEL